jgi:hypothetical protein
MPYNNNNINETNVSYLNKDFTSFKRSLINYAKSYFPDSYRDFNESSPGMMLIEMSSYIGDSLSFYIDQQYKEMMLPLAEERKNMINIAKTFGYKVKSSVPAYVDLTFIQEINSVEGNEAQVDYGNFGTVFDKGIQIQSTQDTDIVYETLEPVDFTITGSVDDYVNDTSDPILDTDSQLATHYRVSRTVKAISGKTKTQIFNVGNPTKFLRLTISDEDVIDIISVVDGNGGKYYEVDYLAQSRVPIETHYTSDDSDRTSAYQTFIGDPLETGISHLPIPYSLSYVNTNKRFVTETNENNTTTLVFGNGIMRNGTKIDSSFLDLEQAGIVVPGQANDLTSAIDPTLGDEYDTLGEIPSNTSVSVTYRVGGGLSANVASSDLTSIIDNSVTRIGGYVDANNAVLASVTNNYPAIGGKNQDTIDEIREKTKAFFKTQNRCVTKEDYEARVLNIPSKFGNIAKVYVARTDTYSGLSYDFNTYLGGAQTSLNAAIDSLNSAVIDDPGNASVLLGGINDALGYLNNTGTGVADGVEVSNQLGLLAPLETTLSLGTINIYVLGYNQNKSLVGNPQEGINDNNFGNKDQIPSLLKTNIKNYLDEYRILTDDISIQDGYVINFGVIFDVVAHRHANRQSVKLQCIQKIKEYFNIDNMQFGQPIYISQLQYDLMGVDGVRSVNEVKLTQTEQMSSNLFTYSWSTGDDSSIIDASDGGNGTAGYGYYYDFDSSCNTIPGVCLPAHPDNPAVFELKNPDNNIKGVVR